MQPPLDGGRLGALGGVILLPVGFGLEIGDRRPHSGGLLLQWGWRHCSCFFLASMQQISSGKASAGESCDHESIKRRGEITRAECGHMHAGAEACFFFAFFPGEVILFRRVFGMSSSKNMAVISSEYGQG